ncbi:Epithelial discoidin domain-containing receptor 1-like protein [Aix galericulata]|nr:Epithelial discoidin domain-containing receptor 1-like protein [Aix galericulata]
MEDGSIPDSRLSASSAWSDSTAARHGRVPGVTAGSPSCSCCCSPLAREPQYGPVWPSMAQYGPVWTSAHTQRCPVMPWVSPCPPGNLPVPRGPHDPG